MVGDLSINLTLTQKGLLLVSVPLVFELGFVCYLWNIVEKSDQELRRQEHAREILTHMNSLTRKLVEAGTTAGSYSCPVFLGNYADSLSTTSSEFNALESLTKDYPEEFRIVKQVELLADEGSSLVKQGRSLLAKGQDDAANELLVTSLKPLIKRLSAEAELLTTEAKSAQEHGPVARSKAQSQVRYTLIAGIGFNILLALSLAMFFMKSIIRKVERVMDNTYRLARRQPLNPPLGGNDEISHLDQVLRDMAKALDAANRKERAIFENARDLICTIAEGGVFSNVSPACAEILGYSPQELEGKWIVEVVVEEEVSATIELLKKLFKGECTQPFETRMKRKNGKIVHLLWSAQWSAQESCLFCVGHEITERKVAEELLRASEARTRSILETTPVGIMTIDEKGMIEVGNPAVGAMFGCGIAELKGVPVTAIFKSADKRAAGDFLRDAANKTFSIDAKKKNGQIFPTEVTVREFPGSDARQYLMVVLDISERHQIEQMKQEFVAMVSHELRTPLTSVQGFLDLLSEGGYGQISENAHTKCEVASRNVSRLIDLINDILDAEKLESGKFEFRFSEVDMNVVMSRSMDAVRDFAEKSGVRMQAQPCNLRTVADQDRLIQVVINMLSNAIKFSPSGSTVYIGVQESERFLELSVVDQGAGIPEDARQLIFERFGKSTSQKTGHKGSGLGLAISKKIIEQHNGQIGVESEPGKGSRFWFKLPKALNLAPARH